LKGGKIIKTLGVLIILFVFISASYAADTIDQTDPNIVDAEFDDSGLDDSGLDDSGLDDSGLDDSGLDDTTGEDEIPNDVSEDPYDPGTDETYPYDEPATDPLNNEIDPVIYYTMSYGVTQENLEDTTDGVILDGDGSTEDNTLEIDSDEITDDNNEIDDNYTLDDTEILYKGDSQDESAQVSLDPEQVRGVETEQTKAETIPMQKTGTPALPAALGILCLLGGLMVNRHKP
jgi:hypothetical protein